MHSTWQSPATNIPSRRMARGERQGLRNEASCTRLSRHAWTALIAVSLALGGWPGPGSAQTAGYPSKPVRIIAPFPPGGSVDLVARLVTDRFSEALGQQVVIDNRSGASGSIGTELAARSAPDGYTLLMHTVPFVTNGHLYRQVPYSVVNDFAPVSLLSTSPSAVAVHPSVPARSVGELLKLARARPGVLNFASAGIGTNSHISGELLNLLGKVNIVPIHFKGGGPALTATVSGEIDVSFSNIAETARYAKAGRLRALGVSSLQRSPAFPDLATISEAGLPGYEFLTWHGLLAPKGTPPAIIALLNDKVRKTMASPDVSQRFQQRGLDVVTNSPEEFSAYLKSELDKWGRVIRERKIKAE